jgi:asparagine synthetase B (glutamine-hydrolysing)
MLVDDPVKRVDNMTMASGLEARVPFLDHEVVELAARIPAKLKVGGGGKYILKQAARKFLPAEVIDRPKGYFPVPSLSICAGPSFPMSEIFSTQAKPDPSTDHEATISNSLAFTAFIIESSPGRLSRPLAPLIPASS